MYGHRGSYKQNPCRSPFDSRELSKRELMRQDDSNQYKQIFDKVVTDDAPPMYGGGGRGQPGGGQQTLTVAFPESIKTTTAPTEDYYLEFDSIYRNYSGNPLIGEIKQDVTSVDPTLSISDVVQIKIEGPFYFPQIYNKAGTPEFYFYNRVYMTLTSLPLSSGFRVGGGVYWHFQFEVGNTGGIAVELNPINATIYFKRPIQNLVDFNVRFFLPHGGVIPIPSDNISVVGLAGTNPGIFYITDDNTTDVFGAQEPAIPPLYPRATIAPGVVVQTLPSNPFTSTIPALNSQINAALGLLVTSVDSAKYFTIAGVNLALAVPDIINGNSIWGHPGYPIPPPLPPDNALAVLPPPGNPGYVIPFKFYIPKNRISIPVRVTTLANVVSTNQLTAVHT